jgi:perosamine synthetase
MGSFGAASVFAFYPNKQITTGEGGVVVTDDAALASTFRSLRNQGRDEDGRWLRHIQLGYNYRLDELSAAIGIAQLERLDELRAGRARAVSQYEALLGGYDWVTLPSPGPGQSVDWFVYVVRFAERIDRDEVMAQLRTRGIDSRPYFAPLHTQPLYQSMFGHRAGDFPVTERVAASTLALPFSPILSEGEIALVVEAVIAAVERQSHRA